VVAPASGCAPEELERGEAELRRLGFEPVHTSAVFERTTFSAGSPDTRAADFMRAWADPAVKALVALRGGYGSAQLLPLLHHLRPALAPKLFIGYSDTTALLSWLTCAGGVAALHGPMLDARLSKGAEGYDERSFLSAVRGESDHRGLGALRVADDDEHRARRLGQHLAARLRCDPVDEPRASPALLPDEPSGTDCDH